MPTDSGYSNQKKKGLAQFETIHNLGSNSYGKSVLNKGVYEITPEAAIPSVSDVLQGSQVVYWNIEFPSHGASVGNLMRITSDGELKNYEFEIVQIIDADNFYVFPLSDISPAGLNAAIIGIVSQKFSNDGSTNVSVGTQFNYDGAPQSVDQDTVTPANNKAFPSLQFIVKDGVQVPVTKSTGTPSNTVGIPVEIVASTGTPINITAGDINVQLTDMGLNPDSVKVGNGTGNYLKVNADGSSDVNIKNSSLAVTGPLTNTELRASPVPSSITDGTNTANVIPIGTQIVAGNKGIVVNSLIHGLSSAGGGTYVDVKVNPSGALTVDATVTSSVLPTGAATAANQTTANTSLSSIDGKLTGVATAANQTTANSSLSSIDGKLTGVATAANQTTANSSLSSIDTKLSSQATAANQSTTNTRIGDLTETAPATDTASSGLNGRLQRIAQRLTSLIALFPATLGQKTGANSFAVIPASDYIPPAPAVPTALTVKQAAVTVGTSAVRLTNDGLAPSATRRKLQFIIEPGGADNFFVGSSTVTSSGATRGIRVYPGVLYTYDNDAGDYYIISDTASQTVFVMEQE